MLFSVSCSEIDELISYLIFRWIHTEEAEYSSSTVIEIENPTGYVAYQPDLMRMMKQARASGTFPTLRDSIGGHGDTFGKKTVFFVDYVSFSCFLQNQGFIRLSKDIGYCKRTWRLE